MIVGVLYTLPNFFPEVPAVQISTSKTNVKIDAATLQTAEGALKAANIAYRGESVDPTGSRSALPTPIRSSRPRMCCSRNWAKVTSLH